MAKTKSKKSKTFSVTLYSNAKAKAGVMLSFPSFDKKQTFKGKELDTYGATVLCDSKVDLGPLRTAIKKAKIATFGKDESEWPKFRASIKDGDKRENVKGYAGRKYFKIKSKFQVPVVDMRGQPFDAANLRSGTYANVGINVMAWEGDDGDGVVSLYVEAIQVTKDAAATDMGGGRAVNEIFKVEDQEDDEESDDEESEEDEDEEEVKPKKGKKKKPSRDEEEDEESDDEESEDDDYSDDEDEDEE